MYIQCTVYCSSSLYLSVIHYRLCIWNTMMGTSVLAMPWAFMEAGLAGAIVLCIINGPLAAFTAIMIDVIHKKANEGRGKFTLLLNFYSQIIIPKLHVFHCRHTPRRICAFVRPLLRKGAQILGEYRVCRSCDGGRNRLPHINLRFTIRHRKCCLP